MDLGGTRNYLGFRALEDPWRLSKDFPILFLMDRPRISKNLEHDKM